MLVLVACEFSGVVRDAFCKAGHEAHSCDILPTEQPGSHYQGDVADILHQEWDLIVAHPPCTHLAVSGARWFKQKQADGRQQDAIDFFMSLAEADCPRIAIENPIGIMSSEYRTPDQIIHPYQFGDMYKKATCLWLKGLTPLTPTSTEDLVEEYVTFPSGKRMSKWYYDTSCLPGKQRSHFRSVTPQGMAQAMADQWG